MLKFGMNQKIKLSKTFNGEEFDSYILSKVNDTLIVTRPKIDLGFQKFRYMDYLYTKNTIYGHYEYEGVKYYFRTIVIKSSYTPFPYVILKYPDDKNIKTQKLRKYDRYKCILPLNINLMEDKEFKITYENVFSIDISYTGIGIIAIDKLPNKFLAKFILDEKQIVLHCEVKVFKENIYKNHHFFGCAIIKIIEEDKFKEYLDILKIIHTK